MSLKSEIENYLLENDFSLVDDVISSDTMFVYKSNVFNSCTVSLSSEESNDYVVFYLESITEEYKLTHIDRLVLNNLKEVKFIMSHCLRSCLFNKDLIK